MAEYLQEVEAVNTALATRVYDLLDREAKLRGRLSAAEAKISRIIVAVVVCMTLELATIIYLAATR